MADDVSDLVQELLSPGGLDRIITGIENRARSEVVWPESPRDRLRYTTAIGHIETVRGLMFAVLAGHLTHYPQHQKLVTASFAVIKNRFGSLLESMTDRLPADAEAFALRRQGTQLAAVRAMGEFVQAVPTLTMTVAEIDQTVTSWLARPNAEWGPYRDIVQVLSQKAVFSLLKLRAVIAERQDDQVVDLPARLMTDGAIIAALRALRISFEVASDLIEAVRAGQIPRLSIVD